MRLDVLLARLEQDGLLLMTDAKWPSAVALAAGSPVKGSWWSHPRGKAIFALLGELGDHPDVLTTKLVDRKVTFVHRRLWPALLAIGRAREPWQMEKLSKPARALLARVDEAGELEAKGPAAKELELRLLVQSEEIHTESGAHAMVLRPWPSWARRRGPLGRAVPLERATRELRAIVGDLNRRHRANAALPFE